MGEFTKEVGVLTALLSVGLFLIGTAVAGALAFPKQAHRLTNVTESEGQQLRVRFGEGLRQVRELLGVFPDLGGGRGHRVNAGAGPAGPTGSLKSVRPRSSAQRPAPAEDAPPRQMLYGLERSGAVMPMAESRSSPSLSDGPHSGGSKTVPVADQLPAAPSSPGKPAATPIPGAFWLLGSGLAALLAAKRGKHT